MFNTAQARIKTIWKNIRRLSGDDAYEQYLQHYAAHQAELQTAEPPLSREAFFKEWQDKKWKGVKRCC
ncbi:MAG: YbdD/YjiX family protein [Pseudomonadota bacterium]